MAHYHRIMDKAWQAQFAPWTARVGDAARLATTTADGIEVMPLHGQQLGLRADRAFHGPWTIMQRIDHASGQGANAQALDDLGSGADGLALTVDAAALPTTLDDVMLHAIAIRLEGDDAQAQAFLRHVESQPVDPARLRANFCRPDAALARDFTQAGFAGPFVEADGRGPHEQGATEAQELGAVLWDLANALRTLEGANGVSAALAANQDMFITLAKFRALRLVWAKLLEASGIEFTPLAVHAETSRRMMAARDPHMNILRCTAATFGASLGGADTVTVLPFSIAQGLPNAHARRIARNMQLVLREEAELWRVADPASGAGYVEALTEWHGGRRRSACL
jgi:methylmalonyl-CoA mutase